MGVRRALSGIGATVGGVLVVLGLLLVLAKQSFFDDQRVGDTIDRIVADPDVARLLTREVTARVVAAGGLEAVEDQIREGVSAIIDDTSTQNAIRKAAQNSYDVLVNGDDDAIVFDLPDQAERIRSELVQFDPTLDDKLPPASELVRFTIVERNSLPSIYDWVNSAKSAGWALFIAGLALIVMALAVGPGRFGVFAWSSVLVAVLMFVVWLVVRLAVNGATDSSDLVSKRVARLGADEFLGSVYRVSIGVAIFGTVAFLAGLVATWVRNTYYPPKPRTQRVPRPQRSRRGTPPSVAP
ncbi:MAG: hypothetical protein RL219_918 [Actinomycetota bacterium]